MVLLNAGVNSYGFYHAGSGLIFLYKQKRHCVGWKRQQQVSKHISVGYLGPGELVDGGLVQKAQHQGNAGSGLAQLQVTNRESQAHWRASVGSMEVVKNNSKALLNHEKYFVKSYHLF